MQIHFRRRFEAAHRLYLAQSTKCFTPHGHTWWTEITLKFSSSLVQNNGMEKDFSIYKKEWFEFIDQKLDHSFFLNQKDPLVPLLEKTNLILFKTDPTTEVICAYMLNHAKKLFEHYEITLKLEETPTNHVTLVEADLINFKEFFCSSQL